MDGVTLTPLKQIEHPKGDLFHAMKKSDNGYAGFGEAYFSSVSYQAIKGWKKHTKMVLNFVVPIGSVEVVVYDGKHFESIVLSQENYQRITVEAGLWVAFRGIGEEMNLLLNLASIEHDPTESENKALDEIAYAW
jgi:dTDP-4-dehydrorhamnose 3,5-epimerase